MSSYIYGSLSTDSEAVKPHPGLSGEVGESENIISGLATPVLAGRAGTSSTSDQIKVIDLNTNNTKLSKLQIQFESVKKSRRAQQPIKRFTKLKRLNALKILNNKLPWHIDFDKRKKNSQISLHLDKLCKGYKDLLSANFKLTSAKKVLALESKNVDQQKSSIQYINKYFDIKIRNKTLYLQDSELKKLQKEYHEKVNSRGEDQFQDFLDSFDDFDCVTSSAIKQKALLDPNLTMFTNNSDNFDSSDNSVIDIGSVLTDTHLDESTKDQDITMNESAQKQAAPAAAAADKEGWIIHKNKSNAEKRRIKKAAKLGAEAAELAKNAAGGRDSGKPNSGKTGNKRNRETANLSGNTTGSGESSGNKDGNDDRNDKQRPPPAKKQNMTYREAVRKQGSIMIDIRASNGQTLGQHEFNHINNSSLDIIIDNELDYDSWLIEDKGITPMGIWYLVENKQTLEAFKKFIPKLKTVDKDNKPTDTYSFLVYGPGESPVFFLKWRVSQCFKDTPIAKINKVLLIQNPNIRKVKLPIGDTRESHIKVTQFQFDLQ